MRKRICDTTNIRINVKHKVNQFARRRISLRHHVPPLPLRRISEDEK